MEETGGEPDVVGSEGIVFVDCSPETPTGRRSLCYDEKARLGRKVAPPLGSALGMAESMGLEVLDEDQYHWLQTFGEFDRKTSTWLKTPGDVRSLGGALFGDKRYGRVFTYHNGADSYYASRGFRCLLRLSR